MTVRNKIRLIVYRIHEKGLEVLLLKPEINTKTWGLIHSPISLDQMDSHLHRQIIEFLSEDGEGGEMQTIAIEGDWHDIPRIRSLIKQDLYIVKEKVKHLLPGIEEGAYVAVKEAFKKLLPHEYAALKELKEIILDRNMVRNI
ncbi:MAG: hypothetical protein M3Q56_05530 [Bacteroidota bacterium]|nr:hypothetical protein [Bacteroidota bacterium]